MKFICNNKTIYQNHNFLHVCLAYVRFITTMKFLTKKKIIKVFILLIISYFCCITVAMATPKIKFKIYNLEHNLLTLAYAHLQLKADSIEQQAKDYEQNNINNNVKSIKNKIIALNKANILKFYEDIPDEVIKILETYGYFHASVTKNLPQPVEYKADTWIQDFYVEQGLPTKITDIDVKIFGDGKNNKQFTEKLNDLPIKVGDVLRIDKYNETKKLLFDIAERNGYIDTSLTNKKILINKNANTAKIILYFATGKQYFFGKTEFAQKILYDKFLKKFMPYKTNDVYSNKELQDLQNSLSNSNFFRRVVVKPLLDKRQNRQIPVKIILLHRKAKQYSFGTGFGTDTGIRGSLGLERRYLTKNGHSFKTVLQASEVQNNLQANYYIPGQNPSTDLYDINIASQTLDIDKGKSFSTQVGFGYVTNIGSWRQTAKIRTQYEHYKLTDEPYQVSTLLIPSIAWSYTQSDDFMKPTNGYRINLSIQGSRKVIFSTNDFLQTHLETKFLKTFWQNMQLILHGELGYTMIDDINNLPLSLQYYTGGTQTVRGYGFENIGPGKNLFVGSAELRYKIVGDWYFASFFDAGEASSSFFTQPHKSVGVGVVWRTAIGALSLTYAKAITQQNQPGMIQFSLGPEL